VDTKVLMDRLVTELAQRPPVKGQAVAVTTDVVSVELGQDQSVTLSMLVAEALTNAVKYVGVPPGGPPSIHVALERAGAQELRFTIRNSRGEMDGLEEDSTLSQGGIGTRLMAAFVGQLDGTAATVETPTLHDYTVTFPIADVAADNPPAWAKPAREPSDAAG
jgi:two-component sensor histidine kinase